MLGDDGSGRWQAGRTAVVGIAWILDLKEAAELAAQRRVADGGEQAVGIPMFLPPPGGGTPFFPLLSRGGDLLRRAATGSVLPELRSFLARQKIPALILAPVQTQKLSAGRYADAGTGMAKEAAE
jgi:hypothetical protein